MADVGYKVVNGELNRHSANPCSPLPLRSPLCATANLIKTNAALRDHQSATVMPTNPRQSLTEGTKFRKYDPGIKYKGKPHR